MQKSYPIFLATILLLLLFPGTSFCQGSWRTAANAPKFNRIDDICFTNDSTAFMGQDGKVYRSVDGGDNWTQIGSLPNNAYIRSIEFLDDSIGYIGTIYDAVGGVGLYSTTNGGVSWTRINNSVTGGMYGICGLDHKNQTIIGVGIYSEPGRFYISRDGGNTWQSKQIIESAALVDCLILDENTFLLAGNSPDGRKALILKSTDGGETWVEVAKSIHNMTYCWKLHIGENGLGLASIEDAPTSFITHDGGSTWQEITIDPTQEKQRFGGAYFINEQLGWLGIQWGVGTFETKDGGSSWHRIDFGGAINKIRGTSHNRAIATGNTIYIYDRNSSTQVSPTDMPVKHRLSVSPNPAMSYITIDAHIALATALRIDIMDTNGRLIHTITHQSTKAGDYKWNYDISKNPPGVYFVWMRTNEGHRVSRVVVNKV